MLRSVSAAFGLDYEQLSKAALLNNLQTFLRDTLRQGRRALLIVDEAQNLSPKAVEELRMLSNFQEGEKSLLQSFLLGQPEFREILQSPQMQQLRQRVIASYHLGPMDRDETMGYILHRLKTVGWHSNPSFTEDAFDAIHAFSGGVPRRINTLCDRLLLFGFLEERNQFDARAVQEVIADLKQEVHHQSTPVREAPLMAAGAANPVAVNVALPAELEERITQIERGLTRLIPMVRKILYTVSEGQERD
jgi:type II secretory pathway predicted ATPase ExeA